MTTSQRIAHLRAEIEMDLIEARVNARHGYHTKAARYRKDAELKRAELQQLTQTSREAQPEQP